jgi:RHS repeat-associated protein
MMAWDYRVFVRSLIGGVAAMAVPCAELAGATRSYTFNAADQLVEVTEGSTVIARHSYDGDGERVTRTVGGVEIIFVRDPEGRVLAEYDAATGVLVAEYVYVNGRKVVRIAGDGTETYYHDDLLGTPVAITDTAGVVVWRGETLPFGTELEATGERDDRYTFAGHEYDAELGLHWMHARSYDAETGRFIRPDPARGDPAAPQSWNRYAYVGNNPLRYTDPTGEYKRDVHEYLTRYLALAAGHPVDTADRLAQWNQGIDVYLPAVAQFPFQLHFMTTDQAVTLFSVLPESLQGAALHSLQDSYSHERYGPPLGHALDTLRGNDPDDTSRDVQRALQMALHTFALLGGDPEDFDSDFLSEVFAIRDYETRGKIFKREGDLIVQRTTTGVDLQSHNR